MSTTYYSLLTNVGASAMAYAAAHATPVNLSEVALGDGGGSQPAHTADSASLVNEVYRAPINSITQHETNSGWYIIELVVPPEIGNFYVREFRVDDDDGNPIYIGVTATEFKPILASGSTKDSIYRLIVATSNAATINLVVDPSIVMATLQAVNNAVAAHEAKADPHSQYILKTQKAANNGVATLDSGGKVPLGQMPDAMATDAEVAATMAVHLVALDPHPQYINVAELAAAFAGRRARSYFIGQL